MKILGAGLSGLIAAHAYPNAEVFEAGPQSQNSHRAVLRFRTAAVGDAAGIEFRSVRVNKGIWFDGGYVSPDIRLANLYSQKVALGRLLDRSIWKIDPVERFIAPENFLERMIEQVKGRVHWNSPVNSVDELGVGGPVISTIPLPVLAKICHSEHLLKGERFGHSRIEVIRFRVPDADVFQSVYFPSPETAVYRASITKDLLIVESVQDSPVKPDLEEALRAFGLGKEQVGEIDSYQTQRYGKIVPIDESIRRNFIQSITRNFGIYSVGRFAVWKNLLLDDVLNDLAVVKRLINSDAYAQNLINGEMQ